MNETRYSDSGSTQSSGIGARFIVIAEVAPSIRLEGTKASVTQRTRRPALMRSAGASSPIAGVSAAGRRERHIMSADHSAARPAARSRRTTTSSGRRV